MNPVILKNIGKISEDIGIKRSTLSKRKSRLSHKFYSEYVAFTHYSERYPDKLTAEYYLSVTELLKLADHYRK